MLHIGVNGLSQADRDRGLAYNAGAMWVTSPEKKPMMPDSAVQDSGR